MCRVVSIIMVVVVFVVFAGAAEARYIRGRNWADSVDLYTERIQNYGLGGCGGGPLMEPNTTWWVLGPSDCDADGDMDSFTEDVNGELTIDSDYVGGWRGGGEVNKNQEIILKFDYGLKDIPEANDLVIRLYCGGGARCSVWASPDGNDINDFVKIGEVIGYYDEIPGTPGKLYDAYFDFNGVFLSDVHYLRVYREAIGADTGMFFDSFASAIVMDPNSCEEVALFGWSIESDINLDCCVNFSDYAILVSQWHKCNDPNNPDCDHTGFPLANQPLSCCYGVWQSGFGMEADLNHDCYVDIMDLAKFASDWLRYNNPNEPGCEVSW
ncbi:MAG: hypothetical protein WAV28_19825 [Sedimentisphaerales bacterium]